jgi:hypothetical protein
VPSDFFFFGFAKHCLQGMAFSLHESLLAAIERRVSEIPIETMDAFFELWMERLKSISEESSDSCR